ncbi:NAD(P)-binding protein [Pelagibacteraceae bacterium]|jgi:renalase|nr:NAD(P)-binding protein [Pelagibacteraceae bacterium]
MIDFCILGSGIAGSTIANLLSKKHTVEVFDKARGPGGRCSNKRYKNNLNFDHGAQYISPKSKKFTSFIKKLYNTKIIKKWNGLHLDLNFKNIKNKTKYIGKNANNDICKYLLKGVKINYLSEIINIKNINNYWQITLQNKKTYNFKNLILTCPYPQVKNLANKYLDPKKFNLKLKMSPNITVLTVYKNYKNLPISSIKFNDNVLSWAANENSKKRFKTNLSLWTLQSTTQWSNKKINSYKKNKNTVIKELEKRFEELTGFNKKSKIFNHIHGWKYSYNLKSTKMDSFWNNKLGLGVCGDWFLGPKAEDAWTSSTALYNKIKKNPL